MAKTIKGTSKADHIDMKKSGTTTDFNYSGLAGNDVYFFKGDGSSKNIYNISDKLGDNTLIFDVSKGFKITSVIIDSIDAKNNAIITNKGKIVVGDSNLKYMVSENGTTSATVSLAQIQNVLKNQAEYITKNGSLTAIDGSTIKSAEIALVSVPKLDIALIDPTNKDIKPFTDALSLGTLVKNALPTITFIDQNTSLPTTEDKGQFNAIESTIKNLQLMSITDPDGDAFKIKWHTEGGKMAVRGTIEGSVNDFEMAGASPYMYQIPFYADPIKDGVKPSLTITVTDAHGGSITKTYAVNVAKLTTTNISTITTDFDAGKGANLITADIQKLGTANLTNFGEDDRIEITGVTKAEVNNLIKIDGQTATFTYASPDQKTTNTIKISGITGDLTKVTTIDNFNALTNTGKFVFKSYEKTLESIGTDAKNPTSFDAGNGSYLFKEDVTKGSGVQINNFGASDSITITGATKTDFAKAVSVSGQDVTISYTYTDANKAEVQNVIKLVGITGDLTKVTDITSFNALTNIGDITFA